MGIGNQECLPEQPPKITIQREQDSDTVLIGIISKLIMKQIIFGSESHGSDNSNVYSCSHKGQASSNKKENAVFDGRHSLLAYIFLKLVLEENVRYFYVGGYGGFGRIAAAAVRKAKRRHPDITLMLVLLYHPAERPVDTPDGFDGTYYPDGLENVPRRYAIVGANRRMVETCDWLVCYVKHGAGNSGKLLEYARRRAGTGLLRIKNICESEDDGK